jgi:hypothetical protein
MLDQIQEANDGKTYDSKKSAKDMFPPSGGTNLQHLIKISKAWISFVKLERVSKSTGTH